MNLAIIGYGKMGQTIEQMAIERGHVVGAIFDLDRPLTQDGLAGIDAAIEFTQPNSAVNNIRICSDAKVPVVVGTTGWYKQFEEVKEHVLQNGGALLPATNFSVGVNITFFLNEVLAKIMNKYPYAAGIQETHHKQKLDAPSGTAISLGEGVLKHMEKLKSWKLAETNSFASEGDLPIQALREEGVPGTHVVEYKNQIDSIQLKHTAFNRLGFASGAIDAAEWIIGRKGVFHIKDMFNFEQYL